MRVPFGRSAFDYVFSFFTSFGYFERPDEHVQVVENVARALRPGGRLVLDYLNAAFAHRRLIPEETREVDGIVYHIARWTEAGRFFKHIIVDEGSQAPMLEFREQVARFTIDDFARMFAICGLTIEAVYGDYRLGRYDEAKSPRMVLVARKPYDQRDERRERFFRMRLTVSGETPRYDASIHCGTRCAIDG
jgi:SAM-dependent methyltransferase